MEKTVEGSQIVLNDVTIELLNLTNNLKEKTKDAMMVGEGNILRGIIIFEEVLRGLNPDIIDDDVIYMIESCVNIVLFKEEEKRQHINNHVHYGVNSCYAMMHMYNRAKKRALILE